MSSSSGGRRGGDYDSCSHRDDRGSISRRRGEREDGPAVSSSSSGSHRREEGRCRDHDHKRNSDYESRPPPSTFSNFGRIPRLKDRGGEESNSGRSTFKRSPSQSSSTVSTISSSFSGSNDSRESDHFSRETYLKNKSLEISQQPPRGYIRDIYQGIPKKDDSLIHVDPVLVDKRFNFWNLPSSAKVLLVSGVSDRMYKPDRIFNLFGCYGNVKKVRLLPKHDDKTVVEFESATGAMIARNYLDQIEIDGKKMFVSFSRYKNVRICDQDLIEGVAKDYSYPAFDVFRRFPENDEARKSRNLNRIRSPTRSLVVTNFGGLEPFRIRDIIQKGAGVKVQEYCAVRNRTGYQELDGVDDVDMNKRVVVTLRSESDAAVAMSCLNGHRVSGRSEIIKVHFSRT